MQENLQENDDLLGFTYKHWLGFYFVIFYDYLPDLYSHKRLQQPLEYFIFLKDFLCFENKDELIKLDVFSILGQQLTKSSAESFFWK